MRITWDTALARCRDQSWDAPDRDAMPLAVTSLAALKEHLDCLHITYCLLRPFFAYEDYPLVEARDLLPSFDPDPYEYRHLDGFSFVAFDRPLDYFQEIFQFDILHGVVEKRDNAEQACPLEQTVLAQNLLTLQRRLPKTSQDRLKAGFTGVDVTGLENYPALMPYLMQMDRAHVMAHDDFGNFHLCGVYASFPSDLDTEIKRFGLRMGKFAVGDNVRYERNRLFVYQYLMELYGLPIASERRTSSALFARRLHKLGERFLVRVLGQSDRTITTIWDDQGDQRYPCVEKTALVRVEKDQKDACAQLEEGGYFLDRYRRTVILRVRYRQHKYAADNVRQDRALSVESQEIIHPVTGQAFAGVNLLKDTTNMFLRISDIVRGEHTGAVIYKRFEVVENTETHDKRLKFLYSWLSKNQRRIIGYSDEFFANVAKALDGYLLNPDNADVFSHLRELYQEVWAKYAYVQQARKVIVLEELGSRVYKGKRVAVLDMLRITTGLLHGLQFEIVNYFDDLVRTVIHVTDKMLNDAYLRRTYVARKDEALTGYGREVKRQYGRLVALLDTFKAIRKTRAD